MTKTARRALRASLRKAEINNEILKKLEAAVRVAKRTKTAKNVNKAVSLADRAAKKGTIHQNKASRIKHSLSTFSKTGKTHK